MATKKTTIAKKSASKKVVSSKVSTSQKVSAPKKSTRKKETSEMNGSEIESSENKPKSKIVTRKYLYAVITVLVLIGLLVAASRLWVVAWVDNKPITKFELYSLLEKRDEGKTTEELIVQKILASEGQKQRQAVSNAELEAEIKKIEDQQGGAAQLDQLLQVNRTSREDFRKLVELQLLKQKLFSNGVEVTDADVEKYLTDNKDALPPSFATNPEGSEAAKIRENVKDQLRQMKINENFNKWLEEVLKSSRVSRTVPAPVAPTAPVMNAQ